MRPVYPAFKNQTLKKVLNGYNKPFTTFYHSSIPTKKKQVLDLSKQDLRTVLCKNLESIAQDCNVQSRNLNKFCVKQNMIYNHIPLDQEWKLPILHELLKVKEDNFVLNNFDDNEIATMINFLCSD